MVNARVLRGEWHETRDKVRERWTGLTDDDIDRIEGRKDRLIGLIQARYGKPREEVEREVESWELQNGLC